jgi:hypothetical protein
MSSPKDQRPIHDPVVDDDPDSLTLAETQLARLGHRVLLRTRPTKR